MRTTSLESQDGLHMRSAAYTHGKYQDPVVAADKIVE